MALGVGGLVASSLARAGKFDSVVRRVVPVATTRTGKISGYVEDEINVFKGIPYGADTSTRRFMAPLPPEPWVGVRESVSFGLRAPQAAANTSGVLGWMTGINERISEDCLTLNVWTGGLRDGGKRPVMVYFHGGGYESLSVNAPVYDGVRLCKRGDVVVVTVNHRLNAFGYLYLAELGGPEFADSGNVGQLDLVLALQWVRDNIEEFGGDPKRVLIFGESGGGAKCATLMAMPAAKGLFHRVATSSGETVTASRPETATQRARAVLDALGISPDRIQELKTVPMDQLIKASRAAGYYGPVVDGRTLPRHPFDPDAPGLSAGVPMMVGTNLDESRVLIGSNHPETFELTWETLPAALEKFSDKMGKLDRAGVIATYRKLYPEFKASDVFFAATTDSRDWRPAVVEIERRAAQPAGAAPTFSYQFEWPSPEDDGKWKAGHGVDLPLIFDNIRVASRLTGKGEEAQRLADQMSDAYIAFAYYGNPNTPKIPHWPAYDLQRRATMVFNATSKVIEDPRSEPRKLFSTVPYENPGT